MADAGNPKTPKEFDEYLQVVVNMVNGNYMVCHESYEEAKKEIERLQQEICTLKGKLKDGREDKKKAEDDLRQLKMKLVGYKDIIFKDLPFLKEPSK